MHHVQLPLTPAARARLTRQSYVRVRARWQQVRGRPVRRPYQPPAVVYEAALEVRAGSVIDPTHRNPFLYPEETP